MSSETSNAATNMEKGISILPYCLMRLQDKKVWIWNIKCSSWYGEKKKNLVLTKHISIHTTLCFMNDPQHLHQQWYLICLNKDSHKMKIQLNNPPIKITTFELDYSIVRHNQSQRFHVKVIKQHEKGEEYDSLGSILKSLWKVSSWGLSWVRPISSEGFLSSRPYGTSPPTAVMALWEAEEEHSQRHIRRRLVSKPSRG